MAEHVNSGTFDKILQSENTVIADFYSDTCAPCRRMMPVFEEIDRESGGRFKAVKVNVGTESDLAVRYDVMAVPTFILFRNGAEADRILGAVPKEELLAMIDGKQ